MVCVSRLQYSNTPRRQICLITSLFDVGLLKYVIQVVVTIRSECEVDGEMHTPCFMCSVYATRAVRLATAVRMLVPLASQC